MNSPMTVDFSPGATDLARGLIASLARSFRIAEHDRADITIVDGSTGWATRALAAIDAGAARLFIMEPVLDDIQALRNLTDRIDRTKTQVVVSEGYADNPALSGFRQSLTHDFRVVVLRGWGEYTLRTLVLMQVRILRAIGVHAVELVDVLAGTDAALVTAQGQLIHDKTVLRLGATRTSGVPAQQILVAHAGDASARIDLFEGVTARPAQANLVTVAGRHSLPTVYESAHRARLRQLAEGQTHGLAGGVLQFVDDAEWVMSLFR